MRARLIAVTMAGLAMTGTLAGCAEKKAPEPTPTPVSSPETTTTTPTASVSESPSPSITTPAASVTPTQTKVEYPGDRGTIQPTAMPSETWGPGQPSGSPLDPSVSPSSTTMPSGDSTVLPSSQNSQVAGLTWTDLGGGLESACDGRNHNLLYRDKATGMITVLKGGC